MENQFANDRQPFRRSGERNTCAPCVDLPTVEVHHANVLRSALAKVFCQGVLLLAAHAIYCTSSAVAAIGDNAPPIPSAYVSAHPRLGSPDNTFLNALWATNHTTGAYAKYKSTADAFSPSSPTFWSCRYTLIAYMADKLNSGPDHAGWLTKIEGMNVSGGTCAALAYDWTYADLTNGDRIAFLAALDTASTTFESNWNSNTSPLNDQAYTRGGEYGMIVATAQYPDGGATARAHLRYAMDVFLNIVLPAWKEPFAGYCNVASSSQSPDCGGGWQETFDYLNSTSGAQGMNNWIVPNLLAWANASGRGTSFFTSDYPWLKNYAYLWVYNVRPDMTTFHTGVTRTGYFLPEYLASATVAVTGNTMGSLEGLVAIYNDADLRAWTRLIDWNNATPDGFEPSAFPFFTPDSSGNSVGSISNLAKVKNFPGWGTLYFRTGWGEDDSACLLRYGANFWSHPVQDAGAFECYKNGALTIESGHYSDAGSIHHELYHTQAIARNVVTVTDSADVYAGETLGLTNNVGVTSNIAFYNDGGQRRVGSEQGNNGTMAFFQPSPADDPQYNRYHEWFQGGSLVGYAVGAFGKYAYAAVDVTAAYNNVGSHGTNTSTWQPFQPNSSNRSYRVQKAVRHFVWIPRGSASYVVIYDQVTSSDSSFTKKNLVHFIGNPTTGTYTGGLSYSATRGELVTPAPAGFSQYWTDKWCTPAGLSHCSGSNYQYSGKVYGFMPKIAGTESLTTVGGTGHEYDIGGTNVNDCPLEGGTGGTAQAGSSTTITLASSDTAPDGAYDGFVIGITVAGSPSYLTVTSYVSSTKLATGTGSWSGGSPTTGTHYQIGSQRCPTDYFGTGSVQGVVSELSNFGPAEPGGYRIEESVGTANTEDWFVNVMLNTTGADTNVVSTKPTTTTSGTSCVEGSNCDLVTVWKDNADACTYTMTLPRRGVGGSLTIAGTCTGSTLTTTALLSTQAGTALPENQWTELTQTPTAKIVGWDASGYAPVTGQALLKANKVSDTSEEQDAIWGWDFGQNRLDMLAGMSHFHDEYGPDNGHPHGGWAIDPVYSVAMGYGGFSGSLADEPSFMTYWFDVAAQAGFLKQATTHGFHGSDTPQPAVGFDALNRIYVQYGGGGGAGYSTYDPSTNAWSLSVLCTTQSGHPECPQDSTFGQVMRYNPVSKKFYLYDWDGNVYTYDALANTAAKLTVTGGPPPQPRLFAVFVYLANDNKFLLFGGHNLDSSTLYNDTWLFDPVALTWTELLDGSTHSPSGIPSEGNSNLGVYMMGQDAVALFRTHTTTAIDVWVYRLHPGGNAGSQVAQSLSVTSGTQNRQSTAWADRPQHAGSSNLLLQAWVETGDATDTSTSTYWHPYAQEWTGSSKALLGASYNSISGESGATTEEAENTDIGFVAGTPWVAWSMQGGPAALKVNAKSWGGSTWASGGQIGLVGGNGRTQAKTSLADVSGVPHFAFVEYDNVLIASVLYVQKWTGSAFAAVGAQVNTSGTWVEAVSMASNGSNPCVAWSEFTRSSTDSANQLRVACWNGSSWAAQGGGAGNVSGSNRAYAPSLTFMGSNLYVAFAERSTTGNSTVYVRKVNGTSSFSTVGSALNLDTANGWAFRPDLTNDGTNLYVTWDEQGNDEPWLTSPAWWGGLGQRPRVHVATSTGSAWTLMGGALNADPAMGSAQHPSVAVTNSQPAAIWSEAKLGTMRQIYTSQWNGVDWSTIGGAGATGGGSGLTGTGKISGAATIH